MGEAGERYEVRIEERGVGWWVSVVDLATDAPVAERACATEREADLYASTVRQHVSWLSEERFREYYGLEG